MRKFYVYAYTVNDVPFYIGKGHGNRSKEHLNTRNLKRHDYFHTALRSYIKRGLEIEIIHILENLTELEAFAWERGLIANFGRRDLSTGILTNMTDGGEGTSGHIVSDAVRIAASKSLTAKHADPEFAAAHVERLRARHANTIFAAERDKRLRVLHADPVFADARDKRLRTLNADPVFAAAHIERGRKWMQSLNADPVFAAGRAERGREGSRIQFKNSRIAAFGELWYKVDLAKKFGIDDRAFRSRIHKGISPSWACLYCPGRGRKYPDYCYPSRIEKVFGVILQVNSEAIEWLYFSDNLKD
jgi:hypothetical protein